VSQQRAAVSRPKVLLVENDRRSAHQLARLLDEDGFDVELTDNGATAIARLTRGPIPDALVTDLYMEHADGLAVARFARSRSPTITAVLVTEHAELVGPRFEGLTPPPVVLAKPLDYAALTRTLRHLLTEPT
jgi:two-component system response regulator MprA